MSWDFKIKKQRTIQNMEEFALKLLITDVGFEPMDIHKITKTVVFKPVVLINPRLRSEVNGKKVLEELFQQFFRADLHFTQRVIKVSQHWMR